MPWWSDLETAADRQLQGRRGPRAIEMPLRATTKRRMAYNFFPIISRALFRLLSGGRSDTACGYRLIVLTIDGSSLKTTETHLAFIVGGYFYDLYHFLDLCLALFTRIKSPPALVSRAIEDEVPIWQKTFSA